MRAALDFYRSQGPISALPEHPALDDLPADPGALRSIVQGLLIHRDWVTKYGLDGDDVRIQEQHLRTMPEVLGRAFEMDDSPVCRSRPPQDRVLTICRHDALLHVALLRETGTPARVRCGFAGYFEEGRWYDHWITERWDGERWVRDDPQIDGLQRAFIAPDFDTSDQPPGHFLSGSEAWIAARAGSIDPEACGIFGMWGFPFIAGNVILDLACLNKVETLPWDGWGMIGDPFTPLTDEEVAIYDELAALIVSDDFDAIRARYESDDRLRVPRQIVSFRDEELVEVTLPL